MANRASKKADSRPSDGSFTFRKAADLAGMVGILGLALSLGAFRLADPDLGLHLAVGRSIAQNGRLPPITEFLYTAPPDFQPLPDDKWLFRLACYGLHQLGGAAGLIAGRMLLILWISAGLIGGIGRPAPAWSRILLMTLFLLTASTRLTLRPELFSMALAVTFMCLLERWAARPKLLIPALAALQVVWVNCHGYFFFGPLLVGIWFLDAWAGVRFKADAEASPKVRGLFFAGLACIFVSFLNPATWRGFIYPLSVMSLLSQEGGILKHTIRELRPTVVLIKEATFPRSVPVMAYLAAALLTLLGYLLTWRKRPLREWLMLAFSLALSLQFIRNMALVGLAAVPFGSHALAGAVERVCHRMPSFHRRAVSCVSLLLTATLAVLIFLVLTDRYYRACSMSFKTTGISWSEATIPTGLAAFVKEQGFHGPVFNTFDVGSSLAWLIYPDERAFINGDTSAYPLTFYREVRAEPSGQADPYAEIFRRFQKWDERYHFRLAILSYRLIWDRALMTYLYSSSEWSLVYLERSATCFVRREGMDAGRLRALEEAVGDRLDASIAAPIPRASFWKVYSPSAEVDLLAGCVALKWWDRVEALARRALQVHPDLPEREALLKGLGYSGQR